MKESQKVIALLRILTGNPMSQVDNETRKLADQIVQWGADKSRVLKACLRSHDDEGAVLLLGEITDLYGEKTAEEFLVLTVNKMINEENFSFVEEGK